MTKYYRRNDDVGCLGCGLIAIFYLVGLAISFAFFGGLIWLAVILLQNAGAF